MMDMKRIVHVLRRNMKIMVVAVVIMMIIKGRNNIVILKNEKGWKMSLGGHK